MIHAMAMLDDEDAAELKKIFAGLTRPVTLGLRTDDPDLRTLIDEVAQTAGDKLVVADDEALERSPGMVLRADGVKGKIFFYGLPLGYEMATLVSAIVDLGGGAGDGPLVSPATEAELAALPHDVKIQVFSTPG